MFVFGHIINKKQSPDDIFDVLPHERYWFLLNICFYSEFDDSKHVSNMLSCFHVKGFATRAQEHKRWRDVFIHV